MRPFGAGRADARRSIQSLCFKKKLASNEQTTMITFPIWLIVFLGFIGFHILILAVLFSKKQERINSFSQLPNENKALVVNIYSKWLRFLKLALWLFPINIILVPYIFYRYVPDNFHHVIVIVGASYLSVAGSFVYRKAVLNGIET